MGNFDFEWDTFFASFESDRGFISKFFHPVMPMTKDYDDGSVTGKRLITSFDDYLKWLEEEIYVLVQKHQLKGFLQEQLATLIQQYRETIFRYFYDTLAEIIAELPHGFQDAIRVNIKKDYDILNAFNIFLTYDGHECFDIIMKIIKQQSEI
jgi:uncharacterized LabA/DUF88 family protein